MLVALTLTSANLIGYVKCKKDAGKKVKDMAGNASSYLGRQLINQVGMNWSFSSYTPTKDFFLACLGLALQTNIL